jgi:CheY-like chemotaxis protein
MIDGDGDYEVVPVTDGEAAWLALMGGTAFDACFLDVMMPLLDGLELTKRIRGHPDVKGLPVVLCTAQADRATVGRAVALSIRAYIVKPYAKDRVLKQLRGIGAGHPASANFEPFELAARRLGLAEPQLTDSLKALIKETATVAAGLRESGAGSDGVAAITRLRAEASNLGAFAFARALSGLKETIRPGAVTTSSDSMRILAEESERLAKALASTGQSPIVSAEANTASLAPAQ